ncbi:hypothetical protein [Haloglycomyces albus]|uniref:hypothetical protein n=1 Tax=Haloglycomyces albus TaxID=526067 RepID=UPI00046CD17F|nr:hypothetical protein [Haloglycomyces albus]
MPQRTRRSYTLAAASGVIALACTTIGMTSAFASNSEAPRDSYLKVTELNATFDGDTDINAHRMAIDVYNEEGRTAEDVTMSVTLSEETPSDIAFIPLDGNSENASCELVTPHDMACDLGDIASGEVRHVYDILMLITPDSESTTGTVSVDSATPVDAAHSQLTQNFTVSRGNLGADLGVKSTDMIDIPFGENAPLGKDEISLYNQGSVDADGVVVSAQVPAGVTIVDTVDECEVVDEIGLICRFPELEVPASTGGYKDHVDIDLATLQLKDGVTGPANLGFIDGTFIALTSPGADEDDEAGASAQSRASDEPYTGEVEVQSSVPDIGHNPQSGRLQIGVTAVGGPDPSPTDDPSEDPTEEPTGEPTEDPTEEPTGDPTENPTESPGDPTSEPSDPGDKDEDVLPVTGNNYATLMWFAAALVAAGVSLVYLTRAKKVRTE